MTYFIYIAISTTTYELITDLFLASKYSVGRSHIAR